MAELAEHVDDLQDMVGGESFPGGFGAHLRDADAVANLAAVEGIVEERHEVGVGVPPPPKTPVPPPPPPPRVLGALKTPCLPPSTWTEVH